MQYGTVWLELMRIYFDTCSLQRPLDERVQTRIILEAEAILALLAYCEQGHADLIVSDVVVYESNNNPHPQKRQFITGIINHAREHIALTATIEQRAIDFEQKGIKAIDALHLALAEAGQVDYFCTCDDRFYRRAHAARCNNKGTATIRISTGDKCMSTTAHIALNEINEIAVRLLVQELGIANTARFINQFTLGVGDSLAEKERLFNHLTVTELAAAIRQTTAPPSPQS